MRRANQGRKVEMLEKAKQTIGLCTTQYSSSTVLTTAREISGLSLTPYGTVTMATYWQVLLPEARVGSSALRVIVMEPLVESSD